MVGLTLISATPSPFARMNRIALLEKSVPFELQNEIPWHKGETQTPKYNPLEKLPILLFDDGREPVYDSAHIQNYIVEKFKDHTPRLVTGDVDVDLKLRQILILSEGVLDAFVLGAFEKFRGEEKMSKEWLARQDRKIDGGFRAFSDLAKNRPAGSEYLFADQLTIADIAVACTVAQIEFTKARPDWTEKYPELASWWEQIETRESFKSTVPVMFDLKPDTVV